MRRALYLLGMLSLLALPAAPAGAADSCAAGSRQPSRAWTPGAGNPERQALIRVLRNFVRTHAKLEVVFVVTHLKTDCRWAWAETEPESTDGSQHYESIHALLERRDGKWRYVEGPPEWPICESDPDCSDRARYFLKLAARHPGLSPEIFPAVEKGD